MKNYCCPFCRQSMHRDKLVKHIESKHDDMIPEHYTAYRVVYDLVNNKKGHGTCTCCGADTEWSEKRQKYARLCGKPECIKKIRETYKKRMLKIYGRVTLLDDPQHQEKMLAHRKIAGKYKWSDGKEFTYMGSYEKNLMEFLDTVLEFKSDEIIAPGPILEYQYKGKTLHWITDFLILPYNLIIEVKDGSSNPNKRVMTDYRAKQIAKEKMITNMGTYSYLRLTNNEFGQLMTALAELKMKVVEDEKGPLYRIHEDASSLLSVEEAILKEVQFIEDFGKDVARMVQAFNEADGYIFEETGRFLDDNEKGGEPYYEAVIIRSPYHHGFMRPHFEASIIDYILRCREVYHEQIHWTWLNPFNPMEGASIGVKTSQ